jgi:hypothetical protein
MRPDAALTAARFTPPAKTLFLEWLLRAIEHLLGPASWSGLRQ